MRFSSLITWPLTRPVDYFTISATIAIASATTSSARIEPDR
jgi:hypothetical protein